MAASPAHSFASYPSLQDASVIVTGGASGIGMEIVRAFAGQGSRVAFLDFDVDGGRRSRRNSRPAAGVSGSSRAISATSTHCGARSLRSRRLTGRHACWSTMPRVTTVIPGKTSRPSSTTSASRRTCVTCSLRYRRSRRA